MQLDDDRITSYGVCDICYLKEILFIKRKPIMGNSTISLVLISLLELKRIIYQYYQATNLKPCTST